MPTYPKQSMATTASKNSAAKGRLRASARKACTRPPTPAPSARRWRSRAGNHRSTDHTPTSCSRARKTEDAPGPLPRSSTRMPGRSGSAWVSQSVSRSGLAPPLTAAAAQAGW